jgi:hypothetical protein
LRNFRFAVLGLVVGVLVGSMPAALADSDFAVSEPNGDISARAQSIASTNKDKDSDADTLTHADNLHIFFSVFNRAEFAQTLHVSVVLDGPGTFQDVTLVDENVDLGGCPPGGPCIESRQGTFSLKVRHKDWPEGTYSLSVTGSGSETATAVSTFTVAHGK